MAAYAVEFVTRYDGLVIASFPDLPGVSGLGRDDEEAFGEAERALAEHARSGGPMPQPVAQRATMIEAPLIVAA